jgi:hypothetical protein
VEYASTWKLSDAPGLELQVHLAWCAVGIILPSCLDTPAGMTSLRGHPDWGVAVSRLALGTHSDITLDFHEFDIDVLTRHFTV